MNLNFKNKLAFHEMIVMIQEVYDTVFDVNIDTGVITYMPELYDYAFRLSIAKYYGEYVPTGITETDYEVAMSIATNINGIDEAQLQAIKCAIKEKIEIRKAEMNRTNITVASPFNDVIPMLQELISVFSEKMSAIDTDKLNKKISTLDTKNLIDAYLKSSYAKNQSNSVLDFKNEEIRKLKAQIKKNSEAIATNI